jgi:hypothetical protein
MIERTAIRTLFVAVMVALVSTAHAEAKVCDGTEFPDSEKVGDSELMLNGLGIRKATMMDVKVYVAGLYLSEKSGDGEKIIQSNRPWALTFQFLRDVDASDIRDATQKGFEQATGGDIGPFKDRIASMTGHMTGFSKGQKLSYSYDPATGTVIDANGTASPPIEGADFAAALLKVSIGPDPTDKDLKAGLLGGACE